MRRSSFPLLVAASLVMAAAGSLGIGALAGAEPAPRDGASVAPADEVVAQDAEAYAADVQMYADQMKVSPAEADRRLRLQIEVGPVVGWLRTEHRDLLQYTHLEQGDDFVLHVFAKPGREAELQQLLSTTKVAEFTEVRSSAVGEEDLVALQQRILADIQAMPDPPEHTSYVALWPTPRVMIGTLDADAELPASASGAYVERRAEGPADAVVVHGGVADTVNACTIGFGIYRISDGHEGTVSAGHCNNGSWTGWGKTFPYQNQSWTGPHDEQWYGNAGEDVQNIIWDGVYYRTITARLDRYQLSGQWVCWRGATTGQYRCGNIESIWQHGAENTVNYPSQTFVRMYGPGALCSPGDSGGPVFMPTPNAGTAVGIIHARIPVPFIGWDPNRCVFTAIDYMHSPLGVSVKLTP